MRIISGFLKGKKMFFLKSLVTRPLRDFVKESTFNIIKHSNLIKFSLEHSNVLDLYSGVGSFGIECISRGVKNVTFVEKDKEALNALKNNIESLKIKTKCTVIESKIASFLSKINKKIKYEIIFFDPPFAESYFIEELKIIKKLDIYSTNHLIIIHREENTEDKLSELLNILMIKKYGRSKIIFANFNSNNS